MTELNPERCETCTHWQRLNPDDPTAPEGTCHRDNWKGPLWLNGTSPTFGYHPATLRRDRCKQFIMQPLPIRSGGSWDGRKS